MSRLHELVTTLREYQELCNRFEMNKALAYFTEDATIAIDGKVSQGMAEMDRIHRGDHGCRLLVDFTDFELDGDTLGCYFHAQSELERVLGLAYVKRWNRITFQGNKIHYWDIDSLSEEELASRRTVTRPFWVWAEEKHPEILARTRGKYDYDTGAASVELASLWQQEHK